MHLAEQLVRNGQLTAHGSSNTFRARFMQRDVPVCGCTARPHMCVQIHITAAWVMSACDTSAVQQRLHRRSTTSCCCAVHPSKHKRSTLRSAAQAVYQSTVRCTNAAGHATPRPACEPRLVNPCVSRQRPHGLASSSFLNLTAVWSVSAALLCRLCRQPAGSQPPLTMAAALLCSPVTAATVTPSGM